MRNFEPMTPPFIHLHVHSQYSLLDGQASVTGLVDKAMALDMPGFALEPQALHAAFSRGKVMRQFPSIRAEAV